MRGRQRERHDAVVGCFERVVGKLKGCRAGGTSTRT
jgi:hypothetical protein